MQRPNRDGWYFERRSLLALGSSLSGTESASGLLEAAAVRGYDDATAVGLSFCSTDLVSLPVSVHGCSMVQSLVFGEPFVALEEYQERMLWALGDLALTEMVHRALTGLMTYDVLGVGEWIMRVCACIYRCSFTDAFIYRCL